MSMSSIANPVGQETHSFLVPTETLSKPSLAANAPPQKRFEFYLPSSSKGKIKIKKNLQKEKERKDIQFSNIGRM